MEFVLLEALLQDCQFHYMSNLAAIQFYSRHRLCKYESRLIMILLFSKCYNVGCLYAFLQLVYLCIICNLPEKNYIIARWLASYNINIR